MIDKTVIIIGGGPAGVSCARELHQHGQDVLILDKADFPRPKCCAGWVTPKVFRMIGVNPDDCPFGVVRVNRFVCYFKGKRLVLGNRQFSVRRIEFDNWFLAHSGVEKQTHHARKITYEDDRYVIDDKFSAKFLVGAGGVQCPVARTFFRSPNAGPCVPDKSELIVTMESEVHEPTREDTCYLWFLEDDLPGYAWYFPKSDGYLNIGIGGKHVGLQAGGRTIADYWRSFTDRLNQQDLLAKHDTKATGYAYYVRNRSRQLHQHNAMIIGDAAGLATADMGEGISPAIESGIRAARAIVYSKPFKMSRVSKYSWPGIIKSGLTRFFKS
jgi:flavin-dependent dehydrogenase